MYTFYANVHYITLHDKYSIYSTTFSYQSISRFITGTQNRSELLLLYIIIAKATRKFKK